MYYIEEEEKKRKIKIKDKIHPRWRKMIFFWLIGILLYSKCVLHGERNARNEGEKVLVDGKSG